MHTSGAADSVDHKIKALKYKCEVYSESTLLNELSTAAALLKSGVVKKKKKNALRSSIKRITV